MGLQGRCSGNLTNRCEPSLRRFECPSTASPSPPPLPHLSWLLFARSSLPPRPQWRERRWGFCCLRLTRSWLPQLNWEVRNAKDIQRLADDGVDEEGLMDLFDVILRLEGDPGSSDAQGIVEVLELCG